MRASRSGDMDALMQLLASNARIVADGGGKATAALNVIEGAKRVAAFMAGVVQRDGPMRAAAFGRSPSTDSRAGCSSVQLE